MFLPKKTIPKLVLGALALTGCGDVVDSDTGRQSPCLTEKTVAGLGNYYDGFYDDSYYAAGCTYGDNGGGDNGGGGGDFVLPDNDPNPTNDPFLPGGDSFYNGY